MSARILPLVIAAAALLGLTIACSPLPLLNAVISADGYTRTADLAYGTLPRQKLDVYIPRGGQTDGFPRNGQSGDAPRGRSAELKPVVVFFYGGSWDSGDRGDYRFVAEALTSQGFVTMVPDYRIYPEVLFPDFLDDAAQAVRWARDHAAQDGGDPQRLFVMGHSAGAHLAAMVTLDAQYLARAGMTPKELRGTIGVAGAYDFLPLKKARLKTIFGPEAQRGRSQPINFVTGGNPPMLLLVGDEDTIVNPGNTKRLAAKIKAMGGPVQAVEYPKLGHIDIIVKLAAPLRGDGIVLDAIAEFIRSH